MNQVYNAPIDTSTIGQPKLSKLLAAMPGSPPAGTPALPTTTPAINGISQPNPVAWTSLWLQDFINPSCLPGPAIHYNCSLDCVQAECNNIRSEEGPGSVLALPREVKPEVFTQPEPAPTSAPATAPAH